MRIGLFGGTYNPIHFGHLRAALEVKETFPLDCIYLIPSATPPHKEAESIVNARERLEMIRLAVSSDPVFKVSDVELNRSGPSYTIDTVNHLKSRSDAGVALYLIMGLDAFLEVDTWRAYQELLRSIPMIIMTRPDTGCGGGHPARKRLESYLKSVISNRYTYSNSERCYRHADFQPISLVHVPLLDISSTRIRALVREGRSIHYLVPDRVAAWIKTKGLYL